MWLDQDTTRADLRVLSTVDRTSERRREELERLANVLTDSDVDVRVTFQDSGAFARPGDEDDFHDFEIHIPVEKFEQVDTDLPVAVWDRRVQVALLFHELGHVLYSDFERFEQRQREVLPRYRDLFRELYNAAEDVVVEAQLAEEFSLARDFRTLNDTFHALQNDDQRWYVEQYGDDVCDHLTYTIFEALSIGILAEGFGSDERFEEILDDGDGSRRVHGGRRDVLADLAPVAREFVREMLTIEDGTERVDRGVAFFEQVRDALADLPTIQRVRVQTDPVRPVEAGSFVVHRAEDATDLTDSGRSVAAGSEATGDTGTGGDTHQDEVRTGSDDSPTGRNLGGKLLDDDGESPLQREAAELLDLVQSADTELERAGVVEIDEGDGDPRCWERAKHRAGPLADDLRSTLRRRRRSDLRPGHRTGQVDSRRLVEAAQGSDRVFRRRERGDERDYSCLVVLDRSGSMDGELMTAAEEATAQLVLALHDIGADVSVLSLWRSAPWLELPFGGRPERFADHLTSGRADGSTPLSGAIAIARERIDAGSGHQPFLVVVTDGGPDDEEQFFAEIERCNVGVYGVYVEDVPGTHARYFDRVVYTDPDGLGSTLRQLARQFVE